MRQKFDLDNWFDQMYSFSCSDGSISILTGSADGSTWEAKKISNAHTIGCNAVSWGPAVAPGALIDEPGSHMANPPPKRFVSGGCDNLVKVSWFVSSRTLSVK